MRRLTTVLVAVLVAVSFTIVAGAAPGNSDGRGESGGAPVGVPDDAEPVAPGVYYLGHAEGDPAVEGYMFVRYRKGYHHRNGHGGGPPDGGNGEETCYSFIFDRHTKWQTAEDWVVNPANDRGLADWFVVDNLGLSSGKWETAAGTDVFGNGSSTTDGLEADTDSPDGVNEIYFGSVDSPGAIAVTIVWARTRGPPSNRAIIEADQVYDQVDFDWSSDGADGTMDFENINSHEIGHAAGLGHTSCTEETMYGSASYGETKKRSLEAGDRAGAADLYA